jgi:hypothetical protein
MSADPARYVAWFRRCPWRPWRKLAEGSSEEAVERQLARVPRGSGDVLVLPSDRDPNAEQRPAARG